MLRQRRNAKETHRSLMHPGMMHFEEIYVKFLLSATLITSFLLDFSFRATKIRVSVYNRKIRNQEFWGKDVNWETF